MTTTTAEQPAPTAWNDAVQRSYSAPVMRQTQAIIGLVVLAGVAAAYFLSPIWLALPAFVGLGLLAAGVTGVCPMGIAVAALPWNRKLRGTSGSSPCCTH